MMKVVEVFRAFDHGKLRQIGLSSEQVLRLCPESAGPGWSIESALEPVGEAVGVVYKWPSGRDHVHRNCPLCARQHISDFIPHVASNPVLWFCESGDGRICLVHWEHSPGYLEERAARGDREAFHRVLDKVPAVEPAEEDRW